MMQKQESVAVIGAGPVGCVAAIALAQRGYQVSLFEYRSDARKNSEANQKALRSINLAVSSRGIETLKSLGNGICERVLDGTTPMKGRMVHQKNGPTFTHIYGLNGEVILSMDRAALNNNLYNEVETIGNIDLHFEHKLTKLVFNQDQSTTAIFTNNGEIVKWDFDFVVGSDGAYSTTRSQLQKQIHMDYSQVYMDCLYLELYIPPSEKYVEEFKGNYSIHPNYLHIWPRKDYMLIALANLDGSFTSTFFAPKGLYAELDKSQNYHDFLIENFPDAMDLMGVENVIEAFKKNVRGALMCVECSTYHVDGGRAIIIGDAAHSMVPFYGQGMNCGFEDVRVLMDILDKHQMNRSKAFQEYSETRRKDLKAIVQLAWENYKDMAHGVISPITILRKKIDKFLATVLRGHWMPIYPMITFGADIPYHKAQEIDRRQEKILTALQWSLALVLGYKLLNFVSRSNFSGNNSSILSIFKRIVQ